MEGGAAPSSSRSPPPAPPAHGARPTRLPRPGTAPSPALRRASWPRRRGGGLCRDSCQRGRARKPPRGPGGAELTVTGGAWPAPRYPRGGVVSDPRKFQQTPPPSPSPPPAPSPNKESRRSRSPALGWRFAPSQGHPRRRGWSGSRAGGSRVPRGRGRREVEKEGRMAGRQASGGPSRPSPPVPPGAPLPSPGGAQTGEAAAGGICSGVTHGLARAAGRAEPPTAQADPGGGGGAPRGSPPRPAGSAPERPAWAARSPSEAEGGRDALCTRSEAASLGPLADLSLRMPV